MCHTISVHDGWLPGACQLSIPEDAGLVFTLPGRLSILQAGVGAERSTQE